VQRVGPPGAYEVPQGLEPASSSCRAPEAADERVAVLRVRGGRAVLLRQRAVPLAPTPADGDEPGWDVVGVVVATSASWPASWPGHGPDVVVLGPADLREQVVRVLRGVLSMAEPRPLAVGGPG
jgi:proteasome accessory factor B